MPVDSVTKPPASGTELPQRREHPIRQRLIGQRLIGQRLIGQRLIGQRVIRQRLAGALADRFRLPGHDDPAPAPNHLAGVCAWAAALGLGGMAVALRAFVGLVTVSADWYAPTVITIGLIGLTCTIGAFASVHRPRLPWALLGVATVALLTGWLVS